MKLSGFVEEKSGEMKQKNEENLSEVGTSRRKFLGQVSATTFVLLSAGLITSEQARKMEEILEESSGNRLGADLNPVTVKAKINGKDQTLTVDSRMTLLDALRERLGLTGTKKGCDHGQCGACTVIVDGKRILSCLTLMAMCDGCDITTIEGLAKGEKLHPMQEAFLKYDAFQCGYCTPGQICSAVALLEEAKNGQASYVTQNIQTVTKNIKLSDEEIRERMSGNLCRCGAYPNIVKAIQEVHSGKEQAKDWTISKSQDETV
ncbi:MAG: ferredoxin [Acidobacteria bacterium]|jgi:xanthine dehydrogenase YagT iron-sulfur-binding subunit|nr:MAG: ferredoxin [Acidobacteriota bacterium]GIU81636.1 MAG: hypothetical protein KatS3mg006_0700 [Pyrinomonadaceae bacterium]